MNRHPGPLSFNALSRAAIRGVFTPEQAAEYQRLTDERDRRRAERDGGDDRY